MCTDWLGHEEGFSDSPAYRGRHSTSGTVITAESLNVRSPTLMIVTVALPSWMVRESSGIVSPSLPSQLASRPAPAAYRRWVVGGGDADDIADAHLYLQVACAGTVIVRE